MLSGFFLRLRLVAVTVDRPKVVVVVGPAVGQRDDVVNLICLANPPQPGAVVAPTEVLVTPEDAVTQPTPRATATTRALACSPGFGLLGSQVCVAVTVTIGITVQRSTTLSSARALRP